MDVSFSVTVEYCNSWGFYGKYLLVQKTIAGVYKSAKVEGKGIGGRTGCFEVTVFRSDGKSKKIHSKLGGDGFVTYDNIQAFMGKLEAYLDEK